jgi:hypothetical protein
LTANLDYLKKIYVRNEMGNMYPLQLYQFISLYFIKYCNAIVDQIQEGLKVELDKKPYEVDETPDEVDETPHEVDETPDEVDETPFQRALRYSNIEDIIDFLIPKSTRALPTYLRPIDDIIIELSIDQGSSFEEGIKELFQNITAQIDNSIQKIENDVESTEKDTKKEMLKNMSNPLLFLLYSFEPDLLKNDMIARAEFSRELPDAQIKFWYTNYVYPLILDDELPIEKQYENDENGFSEFISNVIYENLIPKQSAPISEEQYAGRFSKTNKRFKKYNYKKTRRQNKNKTQKTNGSRKRMNKKYKRYTRKQ